MSYDSEVLADSPAVYLKLAEASGTTAADSSGNSRNGTYGGTVTYGQAGLLTGESETCISLAGAGFVSVPYGAYLDVTSYTVECWTSTTSAVAQPQLVGRDDASSRLWSLFGFTSGTHAWFGCYATGFAQSVTPTINDGNPHHIVGVRDGVAGTFKVYVDGSLVGGPSAFAVTTTAAIGFWIGERGDGTLRYTGKIEKVAFYPTALSAARITTHYTTGIPPAPTVRRVVEEYTEALSAINPDRRLQEEYAEALSAINPDRRLQEEYAEVLTPVILVAPLTLTGVAGAVGQATTVAAKTETLTAVAGAVGVTVTAPAATLDLSAPAGGLAIARRELDEVYVEARTGAPGTAQVDETYVEARTKLTGTAQVDETYIEAHSRLTGTAQVDEVYVEVYWTVATTSSAFRGWGIRL